MAINEISNLNKILLKGLVATLRTEIGNLSKNNEKKPQTKPLIAKLYNLKDMLELQIFDYYIPRTITLDNSRRILVAIEEERGKKVTKEVNGVAKEEELDPIMIAVDGLIQLLNARHDNPEEKQINGDLFIEHFKAHVLKNSINYSYQNEFSQQSKYIKVTHTAESSENVVIEEFVSKLGKNKNKEIIDTARVVLNLLQATGDKFKSIQIRVTENYVNLYSNSSSFKFNIYIDNNGKITVDEGTIKVKEGVVVETSGSTKAKTEPTAPVVEKPAQIEQPKPAAPAKTVTPATPVAQAKPTPAPAPVAKPEPPVSKAEAFLETVAVDADDEEQAMLDELPEDL